MIKADYHVHSEFSRDSQTPMAVQVARAVELGFQELCFAEHVDYGIAVDPSEDAPIVYLSGQPMINVDYPAYFAKLASLRQAYADRIKIQAGLEFGVQLETIPQFEQLFHKYEDQLDFILLSCHQAEGKGFWTGEFQQGRTQQEYNEGYYDAIYHVMQNYKDYSILAHLDLIVRYDPAGVYPFAKIRDKVAAVLELAIADGKGIEINTSSWRYHLADTQPSRDILKLYKDLGGEIITIGSDGHTPSQLGAHYEEAAAILRDEIGFPAVYTFEKGQPCGHKW